MKLGANTSKLNANQVQKIVGDVGNFSKYKGMDGNPIYGKVRTAYLAKEMLKQLNPSNDWEKSQVTTLQSPLNENKKTVKIEAKDDDAKKAFGKGKVTISADTLAKLSNSAQLVTSDLIPKEFFLAIQKDLRNKITVQDTRTLKAILGNDFDTWRKNYQRYGFKSVEAFDKACNMSLTLLATNVCHSQEVHFFVEQKKIGNEAVNSLRNENLDKAVPNVLISFPGINFAYGGIDANILEDGTAKAVMKGMWRNMLMAAVNQQVTHLSIPAVGLGAFISDKMDKSKVAQLYYETLFEVLGEEKVKLEGIYVNPAFPWAVEAFKTAKAQAVQKQPLSTPVEQFSGDVKFLGVELAKAGAKCAIINPSDPDVIWGKYDVGEYFKTAFNGPPQYVGEEDLAATSTACLGSVGICDAYTNPNKIKNAQELSSLKVAAKSANPATASVATTTTTSAQPPSPKASTAVPHGPTTMPPSPKATAAAGPSATSSQPATEGQNDLNTPVKISSADMTGEKNTSARRLRIEFASEEFRDGFMANLLQVLGENNIKGNFLSTIPTNKKVLYVEPSMGKGTVGTYVSANNELSINFGTESVRDFFKTSLGITSEHAYAFIDSAGANALYFKRDKLAQEPRSPGFTTFAGKQGFIYEAPKQAAYSKPLPPIPNKPLPTPPSTSSAANVTSLKTPPPRPPRPDNFTSAVSQGTSTSASPAILHSSGLKRGAKPTTEEVDNLVVFLQALQEGKVPGSGKTVGNWQYGKDSKTGESFLANDKVHISRQADGNLKCLDKTNKFTEIKKDVREFLDKSIIEFIKDKLQEVRSVATKKFKT